MDINVGKNDKVIRITAGVVLLALAIMGIGTPLTWIGIVPLVTGFLGRCPAYKIFGISTNKS